MQRARGSGPIADVRKAAAYIGILTPGSTSRMRAEWLRELTPGHEWMWIDTDPPMVSTARVWQSLAYRFQLGSAVGSVNAEAVTRLGDSTLDLAWIDKAVFLRPETISRIRSQSRRMVHFTPDTAFGANRSRHFEAGLPRYDIAVTTKSFELGEYRRRIPEEKIHLTTQGFDPSVHRPRFADAERRREAVFVGLAEPDRERAIGMLLDASVPVRLGGRGWARFLERYRNHPMLTFEGEDLFGDDYAECLSRSWIGLGLLSQRFPELHTTRTFEIPACGAVLATEKTSETSSFFSGEEAAFFTGHAGLVERVKDLLSLDDASLASMARAGRERVLSSGRDYPAILSQILEKVFGDNGETNKS